MGALEYQLCIRDTHAYGRALESIDTTETVVVKVGKMQSKSVLDSLCCLSHGALALVAFALSCVSVCVVKLTPLNMSV